MNENLRFGGARTRAGIYSEHAAAEKAEGRYPSLSARSTLITECFFTAKNACTIPLMNGDNGQQTGQDQAGWVFKPGGSATPPPPPRPESQHTMSKPVVTEERDSIEWTASEYIAHEKNAGWYVQVMLAAIIIAAVVYLITRDVVSTVVIIFAGIVFAVAAARKPKVVAYRVDHGGLTIGQRYYPFNQFKSFAVMQEGPLAKLVFMPLKRFMPTVDIYVPPENGEAIMQAVSGALPLETRKQGLAETFAHRIRF